MGHGNWGFSRAFVTGGGAGIGLEVATKLAADGADVALFDLRVSGEARAAVESARASDAQRVLAHEVDIADAPGVRDAVDSAVRELGPPDLALNSAGINIAKSFHELTDEEFRQVLDVNLWGSRNFAYAALPYMRAGSKLVLMASFGGLAPVWSYGAYGASKAGVIGLATALRIESKPRGIGVSVVCPPNVPTFMSQNEEASMHPVQKALKDTAGTISVDFAARAILSGAKRGKHLILPGLLTKLVYLALKLAPMALFHLISDSTTRRELKKHPEAAPDWSKRIPPPLENSGE